MKNMLPQALKNGRAVPAFNFYNLESLKAIQAAAKELRAPVIFAASESAVKYMGDDFLRWAAQNNFVHLDHGLSFESCKHAIALGFKSVMIDGSALPFAENVKLTRRVVEYAHKHGVLVEAELGTLCGTEDDIKNKRCAFTDPAEAKKFVELTGCDSLAIAIGTSHGAFKRSWSSRGMGPLTLTEGSRSSTTLHFDILKEIRALLPRTPLVLHGASRIPEKYTKALGLKHAGGIPAAEIKRAIKGGIAKVNIDSDARLAWTATMKQMLGKLNDNFDPRHYLAAASNEMTELYKKEIKLIYG